MTSNTYHLERIFHPVGQGAFYSEIHHYRHHLKASVVYDCGSITCRDTIQELIDKSPSGNKIDLLFISHFHADHYNGIDFLDPAYIVLPMLSEWEKVLFWVGNELNICAFDVNYEESIRRQFPRARFISVQQINGEENEPQVLELDPDGEAAIPRPGETTRQVESGTRLHLWRDTAWDYIPVNPKLDEALIENFKQRLAAEGIEYAALRALNHDYFATHREKIKKVYKEIGSPNEHSMAVYSGPSTPCKTFSQISLLYMRRTHFCVNHVESLLEPHHWAFCGCLYLGDMNLKERDGTQSQLLKKIYGLLPSAVYDCLSTIQVPHHGSLENFNSALLSWYDKITESWKPWYGPMLYVISAEDPNRYGHPSKEVLERLVNHHWVSQHPETGLIEHCFFE